MGVLPSQNRVSKILWRSLVILGLLTAWRFMGVYRSLQVKQQNESLAPQNTERLFSKIPNRCLPVCNQPPEVNMTKAAVRVAKPAVQRSTSTGITRVADIPKKPKDPNSIRIAVAEAPLIASKVKWVNGKGTCIKKGDKGRKSTQDKKVHIDQQCCLDPDEIPNPRCLYK